MAKADDADRRWQQMWSKPFDKPELLVEMKTDLEIAVSQRRDIEKFKIAAMNFGITEMIDRIIYRFRAWRRWRAMWRKPFQI